ncbi:50S ribosomal protein L31 [bacterium]|nr:50S ribosomal protein L31 [bacterium]
MKKGIHPKYYPQAKISCTCGAKFTVGSTVPEMEVEICSHCHPFYTGQKRLVDTTGRVQKFKERLAKTHKIKNSNLHSKKKEKNKDQKQKETKKNKK